MLLLLLKHWTESLTESSGRSLLSSPSVGALYLVNSSVPAAPAWPHDCHQGFFFFFIRPVEAQVSVDALTSPFNLLFLVLITAVKTFHPSFSISESLICRAQDYIMDVAALFQRTEWQGKRRKHWKVKFTLFPLLNHGNVHQQWIYYLTNTCRMWTHQLLAVCDSQWAVKDGCIKVNSSDGDMMAWNGSYHYFDMKWCDDVCASRKLKL